MVFLKRPAHIGLGATLAMSRRIEKRGFNSEHVQVKVVRTWNAIYVQFMFTYPFSSSKRP